MTFTCAVLVLTIPGSLWAAQAAPAAPATLTVVGDSGKSVSLMPADLRNMPRTRVEVKTEDGITNVYEGVLVGELLKRAGAPLGSELRGNAVASYVVASVPTATRCCSRSPSSILPSRATTSSWPIQLTANHCLPTRARCGLSPRRTRGPRGRSECWKKLEVVRLRK